MREVKLIEIIKLFNTSFNKNIKTRHIIYRILKEKNIKLRNKSETMLIKYKKFHPIIFKLRENKHSLEYIRKYCAKRGCKMNTVSYIRNVLNKKW